MRLCRPLFALFCVSILLFAASSAFAQLPAPDDKPVSGVRIPVLSPDGRQMAFVWRGDVWVGNSDGGRATRLTDHVEYDGYPVWSPDGNYIAFSSVRNGNYDIFVVPAKGGSARQMTFSGSNEIATDWSPDGKTILFVAARDVPNSTIFALDVASGRFRKVTEDYMPLANPVFSPDGSRIAFMRSGFPWTRPRYNGSGAAQILSLDLAAGRRTVIADDGKQHLWPKFTSDGKGVVAVTTAKMAENAQWLNRAPLKYVNTVETTPNLYWFPASGGAPKPLTHFASGNVGWPSVARKSGDIAFEQERDVYLLKSGSDMPKKVEFYCPTDDKQNATQRVAFTNSEVTEAEISPDGKTFAFVAKNDIWTIAVEKQKTNRNAEDAKRLTEWAGFDRDFTWSKDGKQIFFVSDRDGNDRIYATDIASGKTRPIWEGTADARSPKISPDGTMVGFWVRGSVTQKTGGLYVKPTAPDQAAVAPKQVLMIPSAVQGEFTWSPDMQWIAYTKSGTENFADNLYIARADGSGAVNVTKLNSEHGQPTWSPDGKYLFFSSDRDGGGLYVLPLQQETARTDDLDEIKYEAPKTPVKITIDFEDTPQRIRKLSGQVVDGDLQIVNGTLYFVSGGDVYSATYDGKTVTKLTAGGGIANLRVANEGKMLAFFRNGALFTQDAKPNAPATAITFNAVWERDVRGERHAAFNQFWRAYNTNFYDPNFHGRDWTSIRHRYEPLLDSIGTRDEFAFLLNRMIGELEASHSEVSPAPEPIPAPVTRNLGVYFDYDYEGQGIKVRAVPKRAPGSYAKTRISAGDYILAIDGKDVTLDENLYKVLNDKGDRDFELLVNNKPSKEGARTVRYRALTLAEWNDIHYRNRTERLRNETEKKSNGKIAYVHIQGMGLDNQTTFEREFYEYAEGKDAVVVDVRFNGGGNIADRLINWLGVKPYSTFVPRDGYAFDGPPPFAGRSWRKPIVVMMNERSFSNAEMFPYGMRAAGIAKLVGQPTPGYVIWTNGLTLVDGTRARMPGSGSYRKDGSPAENKGEMPDYVVPLTNEDWLTDKDPQLEKAIQLLLSGQVKR